MNNISAIQSAYSTTSAQMGWSDAAARDAFIKAGDADGSGGISLAELRSGLAKGPLRSEELRTALRSAADADQDGVVEQSEFSNLEASLAAFVANGAAPGGQEVTAASLAALYADPQSGAANGLTALFKPRETAAATADASPPAGADGTEQAAAPDETASAGETGGAPAADEAPQTGDPEAQADAPAQPGGQDAAAGEDVAQGETDAAHDCSRPESTEAGDAAPNAGAQPATDAGETAPTPPDGDAPGNPLSSGALDAYVGQPLTEAVAGLVNAGVTDIRTGTPDSLFTQDFVPGRATIIHDASTKVLSISIEGGERTTASAPKGGSSAGAPADSVDDGQTQEIADWLNGAPGGGAPVDAGESQAIADWLNGAPQTNAPTDAGDVQAIADWLNSQAGATGSSTSTTTEGSAGIGATDASSPQTEAGQSGASTSAGTADARTSAPLPDPAAVRDLVGKLESVLAGLPQSGAISDAEQLEVADAVNALVTALDANGDNTLSPLEVGVGLSLTELSPTELQQLLSIATG